MTMRYRASVLAFAIGCATAKSVTTRDIVMESAFDVEVGVDWAQTASYERQCVEGSPILGKCGGGVPLWVWFPTAALLHAGVSLVLPKGFWRTAWQAFTIGVEGKTVWRNAYIDGIVPF